MNQHEIPPITSDMRAAAMKQRSGYLYVIDPVSQGEEDVPGEGIIGAFQVEGDGSIGEFHANSKHDAKKAACARFGPINPLETALCDHLIYGGSDATLVHTLQNSDVFAPVTPASTDPLIFVTDSGDKALYFFTSEHRLEGKRSRYHTFRGSDLFTNLPADTSIVINHGSIVSVTLRS